MNPQDRIRQIQAEAVMLTSNSNRKKLRLSESAALLERASSLNIELATLQEANKHLSSVIAPIQKKLVEFEQELDAPPAEDTAPPAAPEDPGPAAPAEDPALDGGGDGEGMSADEAASIIDTAIEALRASGNTEVVADLERVSSQIADGTDDPAAEVENNVDMSDVPPMDDADIPKLESVKYRKSFVESYRKLRDRYKRLKESSAKLLRQYKHLNESSPRKGEGSSTALREAVERANKCEEAAKELAGRYNTDMISLAKYIWTIKESALYAVHKDKLDECKTWKDFDAASTAILSEAKKASLAPAKPGADKPGAIVENGGKPVKPQLDESGKPLNEDTTPEVHPMVASITRSRRHTPFYS